MTTSPRATHRVAILGLGAIGTKVLASLRERILPDGEFIGLDHAEVAQAKSHALRVPMATSIQQILDWKPDLVVECGGHSVVSTCGAATLHAGVDFMIVSIGVLADDDLRAMLEAAAAASGAKLIKVSGAIGGLDALQAAHHAGLNEVRYTGRKAPHAWHGTPADNLFDLAKLEAAAIVYEGTAGEAARLFPKNANVTAAIALAGVGFAHTKVRLIADPAVTQNVHELDVNGAFGRFSMRLENNPLPDNPKTSWLAALSIDSQLQQYFS